MANISLEPGGQFELSGAPLETMHDICEETGQHLDEVKAVAGELGLGFLGLGFTPHLAARPGADHAQGPLQDHAPLHAQGRRPWAWT